jgi:hypothetical protein
MMRGVGSIAGFVIDPQPHRVKASTLRVARVLALCWVPFGCGGNGSSAVATLSNEELMDPKTCGQCHSEQYAEWSGSMHAYASDDPLFSALNQRAQEEAALGPFCASCHAPLAVRTGATKDGRNLASLPDALRGVTCYACHALNEVTNTHNAGLRLADDGVMRGPLSDALPNSAHGSLYSPLHDRRRLESATQCGSCHDVVNGHGVAIERSFAEWQASAFASASGNTCGQCHMPKARELAPIADFPGAPARERHGHRFPAVDLALNDFPEAEAQRDALQSLLDTTLQTALCVRGTGSNSSLVVVADNVAAGHDFPSGAAQDRRLWFQVEAFADGKPLYQSGLVAAGHDPSLASDPDLWLISDCLLDQAGNAVSKLWAAEGVDSNLMPAQLSFDRSSTLFYQTHLTRSFPKDPLQNLGRYPERVTLDVHLQPFPFELFDTLFAAPEQLNLTVEQVAELRAKLVPLRVGAQLVWTAEGSQDVAHGGHRFLDQGVPMACVSTTDMNAAADKVPAPEHAAAACLH